MNAGSRTRTEERKGARMRKMARRWPMREQTKEGKGPRTLKTLQRSPARRDWGWTSTLSVVHCYTWAWNQPISGIFTRSHADNETFSDLKVIAYLKARGLGSIRLYLIILITTIYIVRQRLRVQRNKRRLKRQLLTSSWCSCRNPIRCSDQLYRQTPCGTGHSYRRTRVPRSRCTWSSRDPAGYRSPKARRR